MFGPPALPIGMCLVDDDEEDEEDDLDDEEPDDDLLVEMELPPTGPCGAAAGAGA